MQKDPPIVVFLDDRTYKQHQKQQNEHRSPRIEHHSEDEDYEQGDKGIAQLPKISDHDRSVDGLINPVSVVGLQAAVIMHTGPPNPWLEAGASTLRTNRRHRQSRKCF